MTQAQHEAASPSEVFHHQRAGHGYRERLKILVAGVQPRVVEVCKVQDCVSPEEVSVFLRDFYGQMISARVIDGILCSERKAVAIEWRLWAPWPRHEAAWESVSRGPVCHESLPFLPERVSAHEQMLNAISSQHFEPSLQLR